VLPVKHTDYLSVFDVYVAGVEVKVVEEERWKSAGCGLEGNKVG
jgi:hypothetical protein